MGILETIAPIFGIMVIGWALRKTGIVGREGVRILSDYAYYVGFPILVFVSLRDIDFVTLLDYKLYLVNFISIFLIAGIAYAVAKALKFNNKLKAAFILCAVFGNVAYMGFPLNSLALGEVAMPFASIIAAIYITLTFTFGLFILRHYSGVKTKTKFWILRVPLIWGVILGLLFSCMRLPLPFSNLFAMVAASASPVALVAIGTFLYDVEFGKCVKEIAILSSLKLVLLPAAVLLVSLALGFKDLAFKSSLLQAATPVAITAFILTHRFGTESDFVASTIVTTTLVSIATLSLVLFFI
ncbi:hypothetical protein ES703_30554 [subsurface metagenome]